MIFKQVALSRSGAWLAVMGAVLAVDDGSRKVTDADIDVGVSKSLRTGVVLSVRRPQTLGTVRALILICTAAMRCVERAFVVLDTAASGCGFRGADAVT